MPVRNEDWVIGLSARAVLMWCDLLIVLEHRCTDRTREILEEIMAEHGDRVLVMESHDEQWEEMKHRQAMLTVARQYGATHIVTVDADEVLTGNLIGHIRGHVAAAPKGTTLVLPWRCLRGGLDQYHIAGTWGNSDKSTAFKDEPRCHWTAEGGYDFHHTHPCGRPYIPFKPTAYGGLFHLQFASDRRLRAKQALYKMLEVIRWPGRKPVEVIDRMYNVAVYGFEEPAKWVGPLADVPAEWWKGYEHLVEHLNLNAEPWQAAECKRLYLEHGPAKFAGLDLFGVIS